jgi:ParB/RepB/Spo0J family partition protein
MTLPDYQSILIDQITPSRYQARKNIPEDSITRLSLSLKSEGLLQAIVVRRISAPSPFSGEGGGEGPSSGLRPPHDDLGLVRINKESVAAGLPSPEKGEGNSARYELVSGERRWRAAKMLGWTTIEAKVIQTVSEAEAAAKGMVENLQRDDLNPIEEAHGLADLNRLDGAYWNQAKIAEVTGKTQSHVSETLRLLDLPEEIKENIRHRIITAGHAEDLLRLPDKKMQLHVTVQIIKKGLTVEQTGALVNKLLEHKQAAEPKKIGRPRKDPLASLWPSLLSGTAIDAVGAWGVAFKKDKWKFEVDSKTVTTQEALAIWFKQMGEALASLSSPRQSVSRGPETSTSLDAVPFLQKDSSGQSPVGDGLQSAGMTVPTSDEEEQRQAALEDAQKFGKIGRSL